MKEVILAQVEEKAEVLDRELAHLGSTMTKMPFRLAIRLPFGSVDAVSSTVDSVMLMTQATFLTNLRR